jgi:hypothetical protein
MVLVENTISKATVNPKHRCDLDTKDIEIRAVPHERYAPVLKRVWTHSEYGKFLDSSVHGDHFMVDGVDAGVTVTDDGEIAGLFNDSPISGLGEVLLYKAIDEGGDHLNCFEGFLSEWYEDHGFEIVNRIPWDDEYAPRGWDYEKFGRPDVVEMELVE